MLIKYYDVNESSLANRAVTGGCLYFCTDTGNIYFDSVINNARVKMASDLKLCSNYSSLPLAPIPNTLYCTLKEKCLYLYIDGSWVSITGRPQIVIDNLNVENGTLVVSDNRIIANFLS